LTHSAYWHHYFGHPFSHGCVNVPTDVADWLYHWASDDQLPISVRL